MELKAAISNTKAYLKKYKHAGIVVVVGLILLMLPKSCSGNIAKKDTVTNNEVKPTVEQRLEDILSKIDGAGEVRILLTERVGEQTVYQSDQEKLYDNASEKLKSSTVTVSDKERNQEAVVTQIIPPQYKGAIILCKGGDNPAVQLAIKDAVSKATGLGANQISVLKMK